MEKLKTNKIIYLILGVLFVLLLSYKIPTFARFKNRIMTSSNVWTGEIATKYKSGNGTSQKPYIISNGEELAFFSSQLENNNYEDTYFKITNDIILNQGIFKYEDNKIKYIINNNTYYINGDHYYEESDYSGEPVGTINILNSLENFEGNLDGEYNRIFGYISEEPLFKNLQANVKSLYIENALIKNQDSASIFADEIEDSIVENILVNGNIILDNNQTQNQLNINEYENIENILSAPIAKYAKNSTITNCVNKANINGGYLSAGLIGYIESSTLENAYTKGTINSNISNGIGIIKGNTTLEKIYNSGNITNGLIGDIIDAELTISNSFITTDNNIIDNITNSQITSTNNYYTYQNRGQNIQSTQATEQNLKDNTFLNYDEFVSFEDLEQNNSNVWIFEEEYPVLYTDDIINQKVELNLNTYTWNTYSPNLDTIKLNNNITFIINDIDQLNTNDKYYYISNSQTPLTKQQLETVTWTPYTDLVRIEQEGFYVVYVKCTDNNDNSTYINSDLLIIDKTGSQIEISMENNTWNQITNGNIYLDHTTNITIEAEDNLSGIKSIEYYISNQEQNNLENLEWTTYETPISINQIGEYKIYTKVTDNCDFITYASTPTIIYNGYIVNNIKPIGFNEGNTITDNSKIVMDISYTSQTSMNITNYLTSNVALPRNTKITLMDNTNNKVYEYKIETNDDFGLAQNGVAKYPLSGFKEKGKTTTTNYTSTNITNESYTLIIDFSSCNIQSDINNIEIYLTGYENNEIVRPTIQKQSFNVKTNKKLTHSITTDYNGTIIYNSDSQTDVEINSAINYTDAIDTSYYDKKIGLSIKLVDSQGRIVNKENLKNITFEVDGQTYLPTKDNIIKINLNTNQSTQTTLSITTHQTTSKLKEGTYYIKINGYASYDGENYDSVVGNAIMIPVTISKPKNNFDYNFDVLLNNEDRIIDKGTQKTLNFRILQDKIENANIKVSLYQKDELTAYNQDYTLIDLADYTTTTLDEYISNVYYVTRNAIQYSQNQQYNTFQINFDTTELDKTNYKFVFDLYDGNQKIATINKNIIVR